MGSPLHRRFRVKLLCWPCPLPAKVVQAGDGTGERFIPLIGGCDRLIPRRPQPQHTHCICPRLQPLHDALMPHLHGNIQIILQATASIPKTTKPASQHSEPGRQHVVCRCRGYQKETCSSKFGLAQHKPEVMRDYHWYGIAYWRCIISVAFSPVAPDAQLFCKVNVHLVPQGDQRSLQQLVPAEIAGEYSILLPMAKGPYHALAGLKALRCMTLAWTSPPDTYCSRSASVSLHTHFAQDNAVRSWAEVS